MGKNKIILLNPVVFKEQLIKNKTDNLLKDEKMDDLFIHSFPRGIGYLKASIAPS